MSVNVYSYGHDTEPRCHECGERVAFYIDWGMVPQPLRAGRVLECGERALGFSRERRSVL